jgi:hypothetical protein
MLWLLTAEHSALQSQRFATISESNGRISIYLTAVSGGLVALAFIAQTEQSELFNLFALILFPTLFFLGFTTYVRVVQTAIADWIFTQGMNRIRHYFTEVAPGIEQYLVLSPFDDVEGTLASMALKRSPFQMFYSSSTMVAVINSILFGISAGMLLNLFTLLNVYLFGVLSFALAVVGHFSVGAYIRPSKQVTRVEFPTPDTSSNA